MSKVEMFEIINDLCAEIERLMSAVDELPCECGECAYCRAKKLMNE